MPIAAFFVLIAGGIAVAILYPHLRIAVLAVLAVAGGGLAAYFLLADINATPRAERIEADEVQLADIVLTEERGYSVLAGRVTNASQDWTLSNFGLRIRLYDCPTVETQLTECTVVAEDRGRARVTVPPGQSRAFRTVWRFPDIPILEGILVTDWSVTDAAVPN
ncbi:hypothetical protein [Algicella marina]|uniref:Uncharacterized protein n=1 Tax=Algicella marina TaxID=2683284 RepID=A0A6P1SX83_9RHOB|nr:hypothetical protein [Algicella marina]QHQ34145.1 hypothetical protein GO499_02555 [Algicella marina]